MGGDYIDKVTPQSGYFSAFRKFNGPTQYPQDETPVTADVTFVGWIFAAVILAFSLLIILPGVRGWQRLSTAIRIIIGVGIGIFIMLCNFGQEWEVSYVGFITTPYRGGLAGEVNASVGVSIGLRNINITLKGDPEVQSFDNNRINETINYNERFGWDNRGWLIGRAGFGPYAGKFNQQFRAAQRRGLPYPILWIAEYFTVDGEGIRWGRFYLQAGYFTHIMLWTGIALWLLTCILFFMIPRYGAYFSMLTGGVLIIGNIIWGNLRNANQLAIPVPIPTCHDRASCSMQFHYGWCFWLNLATGIFCFVIGVFIVLLDVFIPEKLSEFFSVDYTQDLEEFYVEGPEGVDVKPDGRPRTHKSYRTVMTTNKRADQGGRPQVSHRTHIAGASNAAYIEDVELRVQNNNQDGIYEEEYQDASSGPVGHVAFRKKTAVGFGKFQKSHKIRSRPTTILPPGVQQPDRSHERESLTENPEGYMDDNGDTTYEAVAT